MQEEGTENGCWYAIQTKPRQENFAEATLLQAGIETFNPKLRRKRLIMGVPQDCLSPLFPGYIFARFDPYAFRLVTYAKGVRRIVGGEDGPWPVEEAIIELIQSRLENNWYRTLEVPPLRSGDRVRVQEGPLTGLVGILERETSDIERVAVLLTAIEYQARVVVNRRHLAAA